MFTMQFDEQLIEQLAAKIADRATEILVDRIATSNDLPPILTREEAMKLLRCGPTKMAELMNRPDFPVNREFGVKIPTHMLMKWIENNTQWVGENTTYFDKVI